MNLRRILFFILCVSRPAISSNSSVEVASTGVTRFTTTIGGHIVVLGIWTHKVDIGKMGVERPIVAHNACTYSRVPCSVVEAFQIVIDHNAIFVPRSVFSDLSDVTTVQIDPIGDHFAIVALGGDASEAYEAKIEFDSTRVIRRVLASAMDSSNPTEITNYLEATPLD